MYGFDTPKQPTKGIAQDTPKFGAEVLFGQVVSDSNQIVNPNDSKPPFGTNQQESEMGAAAGGSCDLFDASSNASKYIERLPEY